MRRSSSLEKQAEAGLISTELPNGDFGKCLLVHTFRIRLVTSERGALMALDLLKNWQAQSLPDRYSKVPQVDSGWAKTWVAFFLSDRLPRTANFSSEVITCIGCIVSGIVIRSSIVAVVHCQ
ncbi:hypothetical protein SK128_025950 [Halocaridina rubra]|uniref:Uncharacterized protein n=1 Tax=Halocaridina rubra TaxID=373956 RepID=A0AAN8WZE5_HALRR